MAEEPKSQSWWQTIPGILTATAGIIAAATGLVVALNQAGILPVQHKQTLSADTAKRGERAKPTPPRPSPAQGSRIVEMLLRADPFNYTGPCPVTITFSGRISVAGGGGPVSYKFLRSDGASAPIQTLDFASAGSRGVATAWRLGGSGQSYSGWQAIKTFDPEEKESNRATFQIRCQ